MSCFQGALLLNMLLPAQHWQIRSNIIDRQHRDGAPSVRGDGGFQGMVLFGQGQPGGNLAPHAGYDELPFATGQRVSGLQKATGVRSVE